MVPIPFLTPSMPVLAPIPTTTISLPISGATVQLSVSYGEKNAITLPLMDDGVADDGKVAVTGEKLTAFQERSVAAIKAWDLTADDGAPIEISWANVQRLHPTDGDALFAAITALVNPAVDAPKGDSTPTS